MNAPSRRVNNEISRLSDSVQLLNMHCSIMSEVISKYRSLRFKLFGSSFLTMSASAGLPLGELFVGAPINVVLGTSGVGLILSTAMLWYTNYSLKDNAKYFMSESHLESLYRKQYAKQIANQDGFVESLWSRVLSHIRISISPEELTNLKKLKSNDMHLVSNIIDEEVPRLRRLIAPSLNSRHGESTSSTSLDHDDSNK